MPGFNKTFLAQYIGKNFRSNIVSLSEKVSDNLYVYTYTYQGNVKLSRYDLQMTSSRSCVGIMVKIPL